MAKIAKFRRRSRLDFANFAMRAAWLRAILHTTPARHYKLTCITREHTLYMRARLKQVFLHTAYILINSLASRENTHFCNTGARMKRCLGTPVERVSIGRSHMAASIFCAQQCSVRLMRVLLARVCLFVVSFVRGKKEVFFLSLSPLSLFISFL